MLRSCVRSPVAYCARAVGQHEVAVVVEANAVGGQVEVLEAAREARVAAVGRRERREAAVLHRVVRETQAAQRRRGRQRVWQRVGQRSSAVVGRARGEELADERAASRPDVAREEVEALQRVQRAAAVALEQRADARATEARVGHVELRERRVQQAQRLAQRRGARGHHPVATRTAAEIMRGQRARQSG